MGLAHVLGDYVSTALADILLSADYTNTLTATCCVWLHYVHVLVIATLTIAHPSLVIFWEDICCWCDIECLAMQATHPLHIAPHAILAADGP